MKSPIHHFTYHNLDNYSATRPDHVNKWWSYFFLILRVTINLKLIANPEGTLQVLLVSPLAQLKEQRLAARWKPIKDALVLLHFVKITLLL